MTWFSIFVLNAIPLSGWAAWYFVDDQDDCWYVPVLGQLATMQGLVMVTWLLSAPIEPASNCVVYSVPGGVSDCSVMPTRVYRLSDLMADSVTTHDGLSVDTSGVWSPFERTHHMGRMKKRTPRLLEPMKDTVWYGAGGLVEHTVLGQSIQ